MFRKHVYQEAATSPEESGGGAATAISEGAAGAEAGGEGLDALPEWAKDYSPELAGVVREAKWQDPADAVQSYSALLSLKGAPADRLVKLPGSPESDESRAMLAQMLGVPGEASEYDLGSVEVPEGATDMREALRDALHAARVPGEAAPGFIQAIHEVIQAQKVADEEADDAKFAEAKAGLSAKWGGESAQKWENITKAYNLLGVPDDQADRIALSGEGGPEQFFLRLEELGRRMGEPTSHGLGSGGGGGGFVSQAQAEARLDEIVADHTKDPNDPAVRKEMDRLAQIARPERIRL